MGASGVELFDGSGGFWQGGEVAAGGQFLPDLQGGLGTTETVEGLASFPVGGGYFGSVFAIGDVDTFVVGGAF